MRVETGNKGLGNSHQTPFPETVECMCGGIAKPAVSIMEEGTENDHIYDLRNAWEGDKSGNLWPHDATAFTIYLCLKCLEPTALFNQA